MTTHITVIGATGGIGAAITHAAEARDDLRVRAVNRGGDAAVAPTTERRAADVETVAGARHAVAGTDVVVLAAQPPYHAWGDGRFAHLVDTVLAASAEVGAKVVFVDNLYAFDGAPGPITADAPRATNRKAVLREDLAQRVLAVGAREGLRVTIGCFSDYFGPGEGSDSTFSAVHLDPVVAGRAPMALYELDVPHAWSYLPDVAEMFLTLALDDRADGRRWVLPHAEVLTQREVQVLVAEAAGTRPRHRRLGPVLMWLGGLFDRDVREVVAIREQFQHPWSVDATAFTATFGDHHLTPMHEAIATTVAAARDRAASQRTPQAVAA